MNQDDYQIYRLQVTTLTPLHIGTGCELLNEYDYAIHAGYTWRINERSLLEAQDVEDPSLASLLARKPPVQLLEPADFKPDSPFFRYVIRGTPRSTGEGAQLREQLKDVGDHPYLPGSSLKGALRTSLAWYGWQARQLQPDRRMLDERRAKFAARSYEQELFGRDPNHDLLRALQVSDSNPLGTEALMLINAKVLTDRGQGSPIEVEAIRPETRFTLTMKLDSQLFSKWASNAEGGKFRLGGSRTWLDKLVNITRAHTLERVRNLRQWFDQRHINNIADFYANLERMKLSEGQFVIQLGWGGGWDSKTFGVDRLTPKFVDWVVMNYRLARGKRQPGDPFPKSRRVAMRVMRNEQGRISETPGVPLGWVLVEVKS